MSQKTREEVLAKLRQRYKSAGAEHKGKLLTQAQELLGYHRKSAIRALRAPTVVQGPRILTGRPVTYEPGVLLPTLRKIWEATDFACGLRLAAMLPEWIPAYEAHEKSVSPEVREKLLSASGRTLDRLLEPLRLQGGGRSLPGRDVLAAPDSDSWERLGGKQTRVAGGGYGGAVRRERGWGVCVDGRRGGLRHDLGGSARDVGPWAGRNAWRP